MIQKSGIIAKVYNDKIIKRDYEKIYTQEELLQLFEMEGYLPIYYNIPDGKLTEIETLMEDTCEILLDKIIINMKKITKPYIPEVDRLSYVIDTMLREEV